MLANYATLGGHVEMGDWVHMGGFAGVHQFCQVGAHAFIANNTAVTRDVPPFVMAVGRPAEPHSVNAEGLKRRGYTDRADPQHPRRVPASCTARRLKLAEATEQLDAARRRRSRSSQPLVAFLNDSTPRRERVGIVSVDRSEWPVRRPLIVLVAGETSGDNLGAQLIEALRARLPDARFAGIAGPRMIAAGCEAWERAESLSVMGLFEIIPHLPRLLRIRRTADRARAGGAARRVRRRRREGIQSAPRAATQGAGHSAPCST